MATWKEQRDEANKIILLVYSILSRICMCPANTDTIVLATMLQL